MKKPLAVSTLDEAAAWLNETTGKSDWTGKVILDAALNLPNLKVSGQNQVCYLRAAIPGVKFAFYKAMTNNGLIRDHEVQWKTCPLHTSNIKDLLFYGETTAIGGSSEYIANTGEEGFVLIEPLSYRPKMFKSGTKFIRSEGKPRLAATTIPIIVKIDYSIVRTHKVTYEMVRITDSDLVQLRDAIALAEKQAIDNKSKDPIKGISKQQVIKAFDGVHFNHDQWSRSLASPPPWLKGCRVVKGKRGDNKISALWNPVQIALALLAKDIEIKKLDVVFVGLSDWTAEWQDVSDMFREN